MGLVILRRPWGPTIAKILKNSMFDFISKHSAIWLSIYLCGAILVIAITAGTFGGAAARTIAGFFVLAGTVGYEILSRHNSEKKIYSKVSALGMNHDRLIRELARTRGEVDGLKDDMSRAAALLKKQEAKKATESPLGESIGSRIQRTMEKMGSRPRATISETAQKYEELLTMGTFGPATNNDNEERNVRAPRPSEYSDTIVSELIHHAVHNDSVEIFAQPIVRLPTRKLSYLELFARVRARAGVYLPAGRYRSLAEKEALISDVDHLLLLHVMDSIRADARRGIELGYFINISTPTLKDTAYMSDLLEFIGRNRDLSQFLIFELKQKDYLSMSAQLQTVMEGLGRAGCRFSIDNIDNPNMDIVRLQKSNVEFVKLDAAKLVTVISTPEGETLINRIKEKLENANITMIVEKMESEVDLRKLMDIDLGYGEGYLFGKPDLEVAYRPKKAA